MAVGRTRRHEMTGGQSRETRPVSTRHWPRGVETRTAVRLLGHPSPTVPRTLPLIWCPSPVVSSVLLRIWRPSPVVSSILPHLWRLSSTPGLNINNTALIPRGQLLPTTLAFMLKALGFPTTTFPAPTSLAPLPLLPVQEIPIASAPITPLIVQEIPIAYAPVTTLIRKATTLNLTEPILTIRSHGHPVSEVGFCGPNGRIHGPVAPDPDPPGYGHHSRVRMLGRAVGDGI